VRELAARSFCRSVADFSKSLSVSPYRQCLDFTPRERASLAWATMQMNLGNALAMLGGRESGTGKLTEAVAAYREALKEMTPQTDPTTYPTRNEEPQSSSHVAKKEK
jgi:hypothetical protein